jgi:D-3-phosphoglycerate dehydrogenase
MNILITEKNEINPKALKLLKKEGHTLFFEKKDLQTIEALFIRTYTKITPNLLDQFPHLRFIIRAGVGLDNIDVKECQKRGIAICNSPGSNANAVAEFVISMMIYLKHNTFLQQSQIFKKKWRDSHLRGTELKGATIGLVGCGAIGRLIAHKLQTFETKQILGYDPFLDKEILSQNHIVKTTLEWIYKKSDVISLHLPLTPETKNMILKKELKKMKKGSFLINTSRGGIVNETDLVDAIDNGQIAGASLDVFETEPTVSQKILKCERIIKTPHIAGYTQEADEQMATQAVKNFLEMVQ